MPVCDVPPVVLRFKLLMRTPPPQVVWTGSIVLIPGVADTGGLQKCTAVLYVVNSNFTYEVCIYDRQSGCLLLFVGQPR